jgi:hypothetical protein
LTIRVKKRQRSVVRIQEKGLKFCLLLRNLI